MISICRALLLNSLGEERLTNLEMLQMLSNKSHTFQSLPRTLSLLDPVAAPVLTGWSDCWGVSCGAGWWRFKPSWQGVRGPAFGLNGATRQMILTATHPSASDSIKRREVASTLSEKLSKVPLIPSSRMSTLQRSFHLYTPQNIAGPYVNCHFVSSLEQVLGPSPTVRLGGDWRTK